LTPYAPTSREAIKLAGLEWEVEDKIIFNDKGKIIKDYKEIRRADNNFSLGIVGKNHTSLQNSEAFEMLDELNMDGLLKYESAFSIYSGKFCIMLARMPQVDEVAEGDKIMRFVMFSNPHGDTKTGIHIVPTNVRAVCANTWRIALSEKKIYSIRHSSKVKANTKEVIKHLANINKDYAKHLTECRRLAEIKITDEQFYKFLNEVSPKTTTGKDGKEKETKARIEKQKDISEIYFEGPLNNFGTISRTGWAAFNSITESVDHGKTKHMPKGATPEQMKELNFRKKLGNTGSGQQSKTKAFKVLKEMLLSI